MSAKTISSGVSATRVHPIIEARSTQLKYNLLAIGGGRPYIEARLTRAPNESDLSWFGSGSKLLQDLGITTAGVKSRIDRTSLCNDAGRVAEKINQYLFKVPAAREGIDVEWARHVDGEAQTIGDFWADVSRQLTAGRWCWVSISRIDPLTDADGNPRQRTLAERQRDSDYVRWICWPNLSVPDWRYGADGKLDWIITESTERFDADPNVEARTAVIRTVYVRTAEGVLVTQIAVSGNATGVSLKDNEPIPGLSEIPFVCIGEPSFEPWWFDDVENMQAQMLNLDSISSDNMLRAAFPQMICPQRAFDTAEAHLSEEGGVSTTGKKVTTIVREIMRGGDVPMGETEADKGCTRYISPDPAGMKTIPDEIERKRTLLFENAGLALMNKNTRQVQTAESKQFDQLDTDSTLQHRAGIMQAAEERLVAMSRIVDPNFADYKPVWPTSFDVPDIVGMGNLATMVGNLAETTPSIRKINLLMVIRLLEESGGASQELIGKARKEVEELPDDETEEEEDAGDVSGDGAGDGTASGD